MNESMTRIGDYHSNNKSLGEIFFTSAEKYGSSICQIDGDTGESETFEHVKQRTVRLAINLQKKAITSNDVLTTCTKNSMDSTIPIISGAYLGLKIVNLDPILSVRNTKYLLNLVQPRIIFVDEESLSIIEDSVNETNLNPEIIVIGNSKKYQTLNELVMPSPEETIFKPTKVDLNNIAVMFFSSGTTGFPKAICHSHKTFISSIRYSTRFYTQSMLHFTTMYWISGMTILSLYFMAGRTRYFSNILEGEHIFQMIEKFQIESLLVAPICTYELTKVTNPKKYDLSCFKYLYTGGTTMSVTQQKKLISLFSNACILFGYGLSEIGLIALFDYRTEEKFIQTKIGSVGTIIPNVALKVRDCETGKVLKSNEEGEICLKSETLMIGYYKMDSSSCFDEEGFLITGDIGYFDQDGCVYITGRKKEIFKYLSWHIVPSIIEQVLMEHPFVKEAVVFGIPCEEKGEIPGACVVLEENCEVSREELTKFVKERVSDRERLRGGIVFIQEFPRTPTGKIVRNEVRNMAIKSL